VILLLGTSARFSTKPAAADAALGLRSKTPRNGGSYRRRSAAA
jgi:hypothetical protein